jgi:cephalosporin hydroxylase
MKLTIDTDSCELTIDEGAGPRSMPLYSREAFELISHQWVVVGWAEKYPYTFSWLGRPIIQLPEDIIRIQEVIYAVKPDVIVETGVAHGGSLVFYAGLMKAMGVGRRVVGVDVEIRPHNRKAIEAHELAPMVTLIEGDSIGPSTVQRVREQVRPGEKVLVILDSCHTKAHVAGELEAYCSLVTPGSYIVATDGVMQWVAHAPRGKSEWTHDNPTAAAAEFAARHKEFELLEQPPQPFNESQLKQQLTHWPGAYLRRR